MANLGAILGAIWSCVSSNFIGKKGLKLCHRTCNVEVEFFLGFT